MKTNHMKQIILHHTPLLLVYVGIYSIYAYLGVFMSKMLGNSLDVAQSDMNTFTGFAQILITSMALLLLTYLVCTALRNQSKKRIFRKVRADLYNQIFEKSLHAFHTEGCDAYTAALINDTKIIETDYLGNIFLSLEDGIMLVIAMVSLFVMNWKAAVFILFISFLPVIIPMLLMGKLQQKMTEYATMNQEFLQSVSDYMDGFETYKNYNEVRSMKEIFAEENKKLAAYKKDTYLFMDLVMAILTILSNLILVSVLCLGMFLALADKMSVGDIFALMFISSCVISPIGSLAQHLPGLLGAKSIVKKYNAYFTKENKDAEVIMDNMIEVKDLCVKVGERDILQNISLNIEKGKKYVLVGGSGSGKSTLLKTMLGYHGE